MLEFSYRVRDPVHGFVPFTEVERTIIDSPEYQRLRGIRQLALTSYVYPGAMHTRFEHSLGVMHIANRMFAKIKENTVVDHRDLWDRMVTEPLSHFDLSEDKALQVLRLAALLHDTGHLPFSHAAEAVFNGIKHEDVSVAVIHSLKAIIDAALFNGASDIVAQLVDPDQSRCPTELMFLRSILSGQIDADRCDYLLRDSLHCGVTYGQFDLDRLIDSLLLVEEEAAPRLAVDRGGMHAVEALILARYYMFSQIYLHKTRRLFDHYLTTVFTEALPQFGADNALDVIAWDDYRVLSIIAENSDDANGLWSPVLAIKLRGGSAGKHSVVHETNTFAGVRDANKVREVKDRLKQRYTSNDLWVDLTAKGTIHKFYCDGDQEEGDEFPVVIDRRQSRTALITQESRVIRQMPKQFWVIRLYARGMKEELDDLREAIRKEVA